LEDFDGVFKVQPALGKCLVAFGWIVGDAHNVIVSTETGSGNRVPMPDSVRVRCL
jgi:hypothetical protein